MLAHNAASHVHKLMTSKNVCSPIQERSLLFTQPFGCSQYNTSKPQDAQCTSIHSGERHFRCEQCNYSSHRAGHLKNHKPTHTGEKFFFLEAVQLHLQSLKQFEASHAFTHWRETFCLKTLHLGTCKHSNHLMRRMVKHGARTNA